MLTHTDIYLVIYVYLHLFLGGLLQLYGYVLNCDPALTLLSDSNPITIN